jgi:hypothetical protein
MLRRLSRRQKETAPPPGIGPSGRPEAAMPAAIAQVRASPPVSHAFRLQIFENLFDYRQMVGYFDKAF